MKCQRSSSGGLDGQELVLHLPELCSDYHRSQSDAVADPSKPANVQSVILRKLEEHPVGM